MNMHEPSIFLFVSLGLNLYHRRYPVVDDTKTLFDSNFLINPGMFEQVSNK